MKLEALNRLSQKPLQKLAGQFGKANLGQKTLFGSQTPRFGAAHQDDKDQFTISQSGSVGMADEPPANLEPRQLLRDGDHFLFDLGGTRGQLAVEPQEARELKDVIHHSGNGNSGKAKFKVVVDNGAPGQTHEYRVWRGAKGNLSIVNGQPYRVEVDAKLAKELAEPPSGTTAVKEVGNETRQINALVDGVIGEMEADLGTDSNPPGAEMLEAVQFRPGQEQSHGIPVIERDVPDRVVPPDVLESQVALAASQVLGPELLADPDSAEAQLKKSGELCATTTIFKPQDVDVSTTNFYKLEFDRKRELVARFDATKVLIDGEPIKAGDLVLNQSWLDSQFTRMKAVDPSIARHDDMLMQLPYHLPHDEAMNLTAESEQHLKKAMAFARANVRARLEDALRNRPELLPPQPEEAPPPIGKTDETQIFDQEASKQREKAEAIRQGKVKRLAQELLGDLQLEYFRQHTPAAFESAHRSANETYAERTFEDGVFRTLADLTERTDEDVKQSRILDEMERLRTDIPRSEFEADYVKRHAEPPSHIGAMVHNLIRQGYTRMPSGEMIVGKHKGGEYSEPQPDFGKPGEYTDELYEADLRQRATTRINALDSVDSAAEDFKLGLVTASALIKQQLHQKGFDATASSLHTGRLYVQDIGAGNIKNTTGRIAGVVAPFNVDVTPIPSNDLSEMTQDALFLIAADEEHQPIHVRQAALQVALGRAVKTASKDIPASRFPVTGPDVSKIRGYDFSFDISGDRHDPTGALYLPMNQIGGINLKNNTLTIMPQREETTVERWSRKWRYLKQNRVGQRRLLKAAFLTTAASALIGGGVAVGVNMAGGLGNNGGETRVELTPQQKWMQARSQGFQAAHSPERGLVGQMEPNNQGRPIRYVTPPALDKTFAIGLANSARGIEGHYFPIQGFHVFSGGPGMSQTRRTQVTFLNGGAHVELSPTDPSATAHGGQGGPGPISDFHVQVDPGPRFDTDGEDGPRRRLFMTGRLYRGTFDTVQDPNHFTPDRWPSTFSQFYPNAAGTSASEHAEAATETHVFDDVVIPNTTVPTNQYFTADELEAHPALKNFPTVRVGVEVHAILYGDKSLPREQRTGWLHLGPKNQGLANGAVTWHEPDALPQGWPVDKEGRPLRDAQVIVYNPKITTNQNIIQARPIDQDNFDDKTVGWLQRNPNYRPEFPNEDVVRIIHEQDVDNVGIPSTVRLASK